MKMSESGWRVNTGAEARRIGVTSKQITKGRHNRYRAEVQARLKRGLEGTRLESFRDGLIAPMDRRRAWITLPYAWG